MIFSVSITSVLSVHRHLFTFLNLLEHELCMRSRKALFLKFSDVFIYTQGLHY